MWTYCRCLLSGSESFGSYQESRCVGGCQEIPWEEIGGLQTNWRYSHICLDVTGQLGVDSWEGAMADFVKFLSKYFEICDITVFFFYFPFTTLHYSICLCWLYFLQRYSCIKKFDCRKKSNQMIDSYEQWFSILINIKTKIRQSHNCHPVCMDSGWISSWHEKVGWILAKIQLISLTLA